MTFPLIGSREGDYITFQYLPLASNANELLIAIPNWVSEREQLNLGELIKLHTCFKHEKFSSSGKIISHYYDKALQCEIYALSPNDANWHVEHLYVDASSIEVICKERAILIQSLKDCWLLKKGVHVYLKHMIPYFSRISDYAKADYTKLTSIVWQEVQTNVENHIRQLEALYSDCLGRYQETSDLGFVPTFLNLDELRGCVLSEISMQVFSITFSSELPLKYLQSIKDLEARLFQNYNAIVLIHSTLL